MKWFKQMGKNNHRQSLIPLLLLSNHGWLAGCITTTSETKNHHGENITKQSSTMNKTMLNESSQDTETIFS